MLYPPFRKLRWSVRPSVRPSAHRFNSAGSIFQPIFFKLAMRVDIGKECPGMQMGKFWQISTELWPLIEVRNWFSLYLWHSVTDFIKTWYES